MATLASKSPYPAAHNLSNYRSQNVTASSSYATTFASPTDSEFSVAYDDPDSVRNWDEAKVAEWLRSINAGQYVDKFRDNNITGENLMDLDQTMLKEMGIKKIGDRVRIGAQAKLFRHQEYRRKRSNNRDSFAKFDQPLQTPPSSGSPRPSRSARSTPMSRVDRVLDTPTVQYAVQRSISRPTSPPISENQRPSRPAALSPGRSTQRDQPSQYPNQPAIAVGSTPRSGDTQQGTRFGLLPKMANPTGDVAHTARAAQVRAGPMTVDVPASGSSSEKHFIKVIYDNARVLAFSIETCRTPEEVILKTLRKARLNETHVKSYCFWVLEGTEPNPANCRRLQDPELARICADTTRKERERFMFRKIHAGEPEGEQLNTAANFALPQRQQPRSAQADDHVAKSQLKLQKLTGAPYESLPSLSYPMSPASAAQRERHLYEAAQDLERPQDTASLAPRARPRKESEFPHGERPASELVVADADTYFPDHKDKIDVIRRMSVRRSQRLSRAHNRVSIASNISDVPPVPGIPQTWLNTTNVMARARPLSVFSRTGVAASTYRDSLASYTLSALDEESPLEPNRKSYVSFGAESGPDSAAVSITGPDGITVHRSDYDEGISPPLTDGGSSLNTQLTQAIAEDGEEMDDELTAFLQPDSWEDIKYIRGKLIGQGSYGSVYLALHTVTAELMAVKQVELPSTAGTAIDTKKNNMVAALKHEIALLRELKHPHIVQYLGSSSDDKNLNIFLEYIPGGSIAKMLVDYGSLTERLVSNFVRQILVGLSYLHSKDIIHRDIKGANILVDNHGSVKISDFGISKRVQDSKSLGAKKSPALAGRAANRVSMQGSVFWMAPEVVRQTAYTRKADIWSLGCLVVEMLTGRHPHPTLSQMQAIFKIGGPAVAGQPSDPSPEVPQGASRDARDFLRRTFRVEWEERPEAAELLGMAFLAGGGGVGAA